MFGKKNLGIREAKLAIQTFGPDEVKADAKKVVGWAKIFGVSFTLPEEIKKALAKIAAARNKIRNSIAKLNAKVTELLATLRRKTNDVDRKATAYAQQIENTAARAAESIRTEAAELKTQYEEQIRELTAALAQVDPDAAEKLNRANSQKQGRMSQMAKKANAKRDQVAEKFGPQIEAMQRQIKALEVLISQPNPEEQALRELAETFNVSIQ